MHVYSWWNNMQQFPVNCNSIPLSRFCFLPEGIFYASIKKILMLYWFCAISFISYDRKVEFS